MDARRSLCGALATAWLPSLACSRPSGASSAATMRPLPASPQIATTAVHVATAAPEIPIAGPQVATDELSLPIPRGYVERSAFYRKAQPRLRVVLEAGEATLGYTPTIVVQKTPLPGGSFDDPATCMETGRGIIAGGTEARGTGGTLRSAAIVEGPLGRTCQIELRAPEGVALMTELHEPGNTPATPKELWLMTCNYAPGDAAAEKACRYALAGFQLRTPVSVR